MLPAGFLSYISKYPQLRPLEESLLSEPSVAIRLNPAKNEPDYAPYSDLSIGREPWMSHGYLLKERPRFTFDPALHQGRYYVQDASSMAIEQAIKQALKVMDADSPIRYLDACGAPGGKTTLAIDSLPQGSLVIANEYDFKRAEILAENLAKWGSPFCMGTRGDTSKFRKLPNFFDIVAVDAPCSGEGMMRKDEKAREQWSPALVASCAQTQREILCNAWETLRPGGFLIYSTCTFNRQENEENIEWIVSDLGGEPIAIENLDLCAQVERGIDTNLPCYRFLPGRVKGEGLFMALIRKPGDSSAATCATTKKTAGKAAAFPKSLAFLKGGQAQWQTYAKETDIYAWPAAQASAMAEIAKKLDSHMPGLLLASVKGKDEIPSQQLALSSALNREAASIQDVDYDTAIAYLQRQSLSIDNPYKGYVLLTYQNLPLGFVKNLGNRANNLYPKHWRILSR